MYTEVDKRRGVWLDWTCLGGGKTCGLHGLEIYGKKGKNYDGYSLYTEDKFISYLIKYIWIP